MTAPRMGAGAVKAAPELSRWFRIGSDGQPTHAGWYDVIYSEDEGIANVSLGKRRFYDGRQWRSSPGSNATCFGNMPSKAGDQWRGLAADPAKAGK